MKEAAGEANMTVITIVLIAIVLGVGTLIVNNLMNSNTRSSACSAAGGTWETGTCKDGAGGAALQWCDDAQVYVGAGDNCPAAQ